MGGFWDGVGNVLQKGLDRMERVAKEADEKYEVFYNYPDERLIKMLKSGLGSTGERMAVRKILQERGIIEKQY